MRPTYSALSGRIQQLLSRLHPPSPPTAQESSRLLTVLRTSFQKELDTKHPHPAEASNASSASKHEIPIASSGELWQSNRQHWQSLVSKLASPLEDRLDAQAQALRRLDSLLVPTAVDIKRLEALLGWYRNEWRAKRITVNNTGPHGSDPFLERLDDWLHTTSMENRKMFFTTNGCLHAAIRTLFQQRNEALLWKWLRLVYERKLIDAPPTSQAWLHVEDQLVSGLMRIAIHRGELNDAAQQFLHACQYRLESGRANPGRHTGSDGHAQQHVYMLSSAWRIANIIIWHGREHHITPELFDGIGPFLPPWALKPDASHPFCMVYHPTDPCFQGLYRHLANPRFGSSWVAVQAKAPDIWRRACMTTLLDASNLALQKGMKAEASFLLNFAIDHYPDILPPRQFDDLEPQLEKSKTHAHRTVAGLSPNIVKYTSLNRWAGGERGVPNVELDVG